MKNQHIERAIRAFEEVLHHAEEELLPCTLEEVSALQAMLPNSYHLPEAYREFLLYGGKKLGKVFNNVDFSYQMARILVQSSYEDITLMLRAWDPAAVLPPNVFVFTEHLGSSFSFFHLTAGDDPPVYFWQEGEGGLEVAEKEQDTFSEFLYEAIRRHTEYLQRKGAQDKT